MSLIPLQSFAASITWAVGTGTFTFPSNGNSAGSATDTGATNPGTLADDATVGTVAWNNPSNASSQNNTYASLIADGDLTTTHYLKVTNFGFAIPTGATINGIKAEVDKYSTLFVLGSDDFKDFQVRAVKGGTIGSTDRADATSWATTDTNTYTTYGGSSDLWGDTWTPADINSSGFGFAISARNTCSICSVGISDDVFIDHIRMTIYYTTAGVNTSFSITK